MAKEDDQNAGSSSRCWERMWAPYDASTYQLVLDQIDAEDIVLEIGAGDLRLSRQMAERVKRVYALEQNQALLARSSRAYLPMSRSSTGDARTMPFPKEITTAVLLMRHCRIFRSTSTSCKQAIARD